MIEQGIVDVAKEARYLSSVALGRYPKAFFSSKDFRKRHEAFMLRVKENMHKQKQLLVHSHLSSVYEVKHVHKLVSEIKKLYPFDVVEEEFRVLRKILNIAEQSSGEKSHVNDIVASYKERLDDFYSVFESLKHLITSIEGEKEHHKLMQLVHKEGHEIHLLEGYENDKLFLVEDLYELDKMPSLITSAMKERRKSFLEYTGNVYEKSVKFLKVLLPERKMSLGMSMVVEYLIKIS